MDESKFNHTKKMNISTIEAIKSAIGKLNHIKGSVVLTIDSSEAKGQVFYKCQIKVHEGKEHLLSSLEKLSKILGNLNGEGLFTNLDEKRRIVNLS